MCIIIKNVIYRSVTETENISIVICIFDNIMLCLKGKKGDCMKTDSTDLSKYKILMTDCIFQDQNIERRLLESIGAELILAPSKDEDTLARLAHDVDGILVTYAEVTEKVIKDRKSVV